jgi:hypothetical protein
MRVLVCGGRLYNDIRRAHEELAGLRPIHCIIAGGAAGADTIAERWAKLHNVPCELYLADWQTHGRAAGPKRNAAMLAQSHPDIVLAFPGGRGTADMVRRAKHAGVRVIEVT